MKNLVLLCLMLVSISCSHTTPRQPNSEGFGQLDDSSNISQLIRSNTKHYWGWVKDHEKDFKGIKDVVGFRGLVFGDPHMGNFSPYLVKSDSGKQSVAFVPVDFDDVGQAPFIYDLARFIVASEAVDKKSIKKQAIVDAYVYGLNNPTASITDKMPSIVKERLQYSADDVLRLQDEFVDDKTSKGKFNIKKDSVEAYDGNLKDVIKKALKPLEVQDYAKRIVLRGGSKDALRLWVLTKNKKHGIIHEFKEWQEAGVATYSAQSSIDERLSATYKYFWPGLDPNTYTVVNLDGQPFWLREKHEPLLDIPYSVNSDVERQFIADYAALCAMMLGQIHGRQKTGSSFATHIKNIKAAGLKEIVEPIAKQYLELVEEEFNNR